MSQHRFHGTMREVPVAVVLGYDRPLDYVFCTVIDRAGEILYSNLSDEDAGTHQQDVSYYRNVLADMQIEVPEAMFVEVAKDQLRRTGNRVEVHSSQEP